VLDRGAGIPSRALASPAGRRCVS